jgi:glycosyltransferase involved in cell wall biosynthesis
VARVLILVENLSVPFDRRVWQESRALVEAGHQVVVICPCGTKRDTEPRALIDGVEIHRYPLRAATGGPLGYVREYGTALFHSLRLARRLARSGGRFDVIHACNPPDLLFLVALPFRLRGRTRFLFDHHDLVPELFESRFGGRGLLYRLSVALERLTFATADVVISTNESYRDVAVRRGRMDPARVHVVRSAPDLTRFTPVEPDESLRRGRRHLVCYLGVMGPQDGVDYALRALAHLRDGMGRDDVHAAFIGSGDAYDSLRELARELRLDDMVEFTGRVPDATVQAYLSSADVCLAPDPKNPLNDVSTMNKIVEYMAMSRPIVSFDLREARVSAGDAAVYATPNDEREFAGLVSELLDDPERRERMGRLGRERVERSLSWATSRERLLAAYADVLSR